MRKYLQIARIKNRITMKSLAEKLDISEPYYSLIENGTRQTDMSLSIMEKLAKAFDVPLEQIIKDEKQYQKGRRT